MARHTFCSDLSRARGEPLAGTGEIDREMLLISWPRGKWRVPRADSVGMSKALGDAINRGYEKRDYLLLVDGPGGEGELPVLWCFPQGVRVEPRCEAELIAAIDAWSDGREVEGMPEERLTIICCTDGKTDPCCARNGFATYKALREAADPARFNILQSCHIGGCRFAASLAVPARRQLYGRLKPEDVPAFLAEVGEDRVYLPAYRGSAALGEIAQTAELAAMRWAMKAGRPADGIALEEPHEHGLLASVEAEVDGARLSIRLEARDFLVHGGCDLVGEPPELTRRWLVRQVTPL